MCVLPPREQSDHPSPHHPALPAAPPHTRPSLRFVRGTETSRSLDQPHPANPGCRFQRPGTQSLSFASPVLGDLRLHVLSLPLAVFPVLLQNLPAQGEPCGQRPPMTHCNPNVLKPQHRHGAAGEGRWRGGGPAHRKSWTAESSVSCPWSPILDGGRRERGGGNQRQDINQSTSKTLGHFDPKVD